MRIILWLKDEILHAMPAIIFFIISFNLINFTERLMLRPYEEITGTYVSYTTATLGALLAGKLIIIMNNFAFINAFSRKPLIYNITWKFIIYFFATILFRLLEDAFSQALRHSTSLSLLDFLWIKLASPIFWAVQSWVAMIFLIYIIAGEFTHVLGGKTIKKMMLGG